LNSIALAVFASFALAQSIEKHEEIIYRGRPQFVKNLVDAPE
jgi:hypothetical protein